MFDTSLLRAYRKTVLTFYSHKGFILDEASLRCSVGYDLNSQAWRENMAHSQFLNVHMNPKMERKDKMVRIKIFDYSQTDT